MPELQAIARYIVSKENRAAVLELLDQLAEQSRREPGNISFDIYTDVQDPTRIALLERYRSRDAFADHRRTAHFQALVLDQIVPLLIDRSVEELDAEPS